jgi:formylmethanofuran dehydrogenase subunit A
MLRITGGKVYDPAQGLDGVVRDVCIADGKIVSAVSGGRVIDARGMLVFPGGVDVHTHVAGASLNFARTMLPEDQRAAPALLRSEKFRAGIGGLTPTTFATGYLYAGMGYTTVNEAAVAILSAKQTHEELRDTPLIDKSLCLLMANNEVVLELLDAGEYERAKQVVAWLVNAAKGYGIKAVNPGGVAAWKNNATAGKMVEVVSGYHRVTPAKIVASLARIVDDLGLPHPLHLHCNNLGAPGNVETTLETMKAVDGARCHLAHLQFHAYGGDDWDTMRSESVRMAEYFNAHPNFTADAGAVLFGNAVTISADGPWQHLLYQLTGRKWGNIDVENETGCGIVPYSYKGSNLVNAIQWAVGLELLLLIDDPWRICLSTDHPNGACFWRYPEILHMLMNADYRKEQVRKLPAKALKRTVIAELDREFTLNEIAILTSAGPARALGLSQKGHLGVGADADMTLYHEKPDGEFLFRYPRYVIKAGAVVVEEGELRESFTGRQLVTSPAHDPRIEDFLAPRFERQYTVSFENYPVELERVENPEEVDCQPMARSGDRATT